MNAEKMLSIVNAAAGYMQPESQEIYKLIIAEPSRLYIAGETLSAELAKLALALREEIQRSTAKSAGRGGALKAAQRLLKAAQREKFSFPYMEGDLQCFCSGYHAARLLEPLPLENTENDFSLSRVFAGPEKYADPLELPTVSELKAYIKITKAEPGRTRGERVLYDFGEGLPAVNASYLLDMLELLPGCRATWKSCKDPIYFISDTGDGVLLPVKK